MTRSTGQRLTRRRRLWRQSKLIVSVGFAQRQLAAAAASSGKTNLVVRRLLECEGVCNVCVV
jgi:hypothetical protein